ncbi:MAG TPA: hypothetical protein VF115_05110, partial [Acidimicrobiia bacterium]
SHRIVRPDLNSAQRTKSPTHHRESKRREVASAFTQNLLLLPRICSQNLDVRYMFDELTEVLAEDPITGS